MDFLSLRKEVIKKYFIHMNDMKFEAVRTFNGMLKIIGGEES